MKNFSRITGEYIQGAVLAILLIEVILALSAIDPEVRLFRYQGF